VICRTQKVQIFWDRWSTYHGSPVSGLPIAAVAELFLVASLLAEDGGIPAIGSWAGVGGTCCLLLSLRMESPMCGVGIPRRTGRWIVLGIGAMLWLPALEEMKDARRVPEMVDAPGGLFTRHHCK
jgi:hypothetical protein